MSYRAFHPTATGFLTHRDYASTPDKLFAPDVVADVLDAPWPLIMTLAQRKLDTLIARGAVVTGESDGRTHFRLNRQRGMIDQHGRVMWETMPPTPKSTLTPAP